MEAATNTIHERLRQLAASDLDEFRQFIRRLRKLFPEQAAEACLWYIASHGCDLAAQSMAFWLSGDHTYIAVLLDPEGLPAETALKAVAAVKDIDPQFQLKFAKAVAELSSPGVIVRAIGFLPALGDYSILIPWLRRLSRHSDSRVRSRSAKLLCELRPNKGLIERQMTSDDARIRASAIEVLWHTTSEDAQGLFKAALADPHHRVVGNALVGLYLMGETHTLDRMIELCGNRDHLFRAAMAWAMGFVRDRRAIPTLQELTRDPSLVVRKRALKSLLLLECQKSDEPVGEPATAGVTEQSLPEARPETPSGAGETAMNLFMFK